MRRLIPSRIPVGPGVRFPAARRLARRSGETVEICDMRDFLLPILAVCLWLAPSCGKAGDGGKAQGAVIAVIDFDYLDTSGEERDQRQEHEARLRAFMGALKSDLGQDAKFRLVTPTCGPDPCSLSGSTVSNLSTAAREAGADILLIGGIHKMSTLVQWAQVEAIDPRTGRIVLDKLFTFRGDTDDAWRRAEAFISEEITALPAR
jgi:Protein of unknown function (DUF2380)